MRWTNAAFGFVAATAFLLAGCAQFSSGTPTVVIALPRDQIATLQLRELVSTAPSGIRQADLTLVTEAVRTEIAFATPGIFVEQSKPATSQALTMRLQFTAYKLEIYVSDNTAEVSRQSLQAGVTEGLLGLPKGTIVVAKVEGADCSAVRTIAADIQLVDDNNIIKGQYHVEKRGAFSCDLQNGQLGSDEMVTIGFAKTVAEIVKN